MLATFRTRDREAAARILVGRHRHVLLRNKNLLWSPLRVRKSLLTDLSPFIVMNPPAFDTQLAGWNREGGLMVYDRAYRGREDIVAHGAQVVGEVPASIEVLRGYAAGTRGELVIFHPPTWDEHGRWVAAFWPPGDVCRALYAMAQAGERDEPLRAALDLPPCRVVSDKAAADALKVSRAELSRVRNTTFRFRDFWTVLKVAARITPQDRTLTPWFDRIAAYPEIDGARMVVESELQVASPRWKKALRDLERCGSIEVRDTVRCYLLDGLEPDWDMIDAKHVGARRRLTEVISFVEELPEFQL